VGIAKRRSGDGRRDLRINVAFGMATCIGRAGDARPAFRMLRPVQDKAVADEPVSKINSADQTSRDCSAVTIQIT